MSGYHDGSAHDEVGRALGSRAANDGGPAFPVQELNADGSPAHLSLGMSLRDWFAAAALQGLTMQTPPGVQPRAEQFARAAYTLADAMLVAREAR
ncbi:MAG: hypothetical protein WCK28_17040 [Burkholderiales bacterium]|jgi:hypothetical protein